jgi:acetyl esterase/lipase
MSIKTLPLLLLGLLATAADASGPAPQTFRHSDIAGVAADFSSLDVYSDGRREGSPVLVFVHGGGWVSGNKSNVASWWSAWACGSSRARVRKI